MSIPIPPDDMLYSVKNSNDDNEAAITSFAESYAEYQASKLKENNLLEKYVHIVHSYVLLPEAHFWLKNILHFLLSVFSQKSLVQ